MRNYLHHISYRVPMTAVIFLLLIAGLYSFTHIKKSLFPEIEFPRIKIIAYSGQEPVDRMLATVTVPIEDLIKKTEGLDYVQSTTTRGGCEIDISLKWNTDIDKAKQQIESMVNQYLAGMYGAVSVTVEKMNTAILPVMIYALEGNKNAVELKRIADYQVRPFLSAVDGVSHVNVTGGRTKEYQVIVKPERLSELNISLTQIQAVINQENINMATGYLKDHNRLYLTLTNNALDNVEELKNLVVANTPSRLVLLKDIAELKLNEAREYTRIDANGNEFPLLEVIRQPDANVIEINQGLKQRVSEISALLPRGVTLKPYYDQSVYIRDSIDSLQRMLWFGLALSLFVVLLFLRSVSASAVVMISIPFSMTLTLTILYLMGYTFNIITLGAIVAVLGLVIDDAVIIVEQIHKNRDEHPDESVSAVIGQSMRQLLPAMIGSSVSTIVIFIPFMLMSGAAGAYFHVLAYTMMAGLASSFMVNWWITPLLFQLFARKEYKPILKVGTPTRWIHFFLRKPFIGFLFAFVCMLALSVLPSKLHTGFLPEMDEGSLVIAFESPPGTTLEETGRMTRKIFSILKAEPDVESFTSRIGTQIGFALTEPNRGEILVQLKSKRQLSTQELANRLRKKIESSLPALRVDFGQVINNLLGNLISSIKPIEIKVFGDDPYLIEDFSRRIAEQVKNTPGTVDVFDGLVYTGPEVIIRPNVPLLTQFGLNPSDLQYQMQTQIEGNTVSTIIDKDQFVNVRVIYPGTEQTDIHTLKETNVLLPGGIFKPLKAVAEVEMKTGSAQVHRQNQKMMGVVSARLDRRDLGSVLDELKDKIDSNIHLPAGYHIDYAGSYAPQQQSFKELLLVLILAFFSLFVVILFLFKDLRVAFLILSISVLGIAGSMLALYTTHTPLNVGSYTGIIIIVGIIAENAIFTYYQYDQMRKEKSFEESIRYSLASRLRPKLMTMLTVVTMLLPLAFGLGSGAQVNQPLAIAVIGGLIFALPLLLVVLPTVQKYFDPGHDVHPPLAPTVE